VAISSDNGIPEEHDSAHGPFSKRRDVPGENRSWKVKRKSRKLNRHASPASLFCFFYAGRPPDVEVEPWDEPDEGEKLRASALPPEPATTRGWPSRASGRILSSRTRSCPSPSSRPRTSTCTRRSGASRPWSTTQELARPRRGVRQGGLRGIAVCSSWQEGQGACRGQGAGEARGLAGGGPLRGGEPGLRRRLPQRHPHAG